ncbi:MAG: 1-deoxy-D-xylulose-5-phosphate synthase [Turicibacter sp.]|nr:1-deoxy-D-xylulose-5-phosphate synthase [Turicibacter sp.]
MSTEKKFNVKEIENPDFLKDLSTKELNELCSDIRQFLLESVSKTGGHLSSNLGAVELTVAMHKVFNSPTDKLIWDVGHQAYTHKILTGRAHRFDTLRQFKGLSGFPDPSESEHDAFISGHSSTSISAAVGMAYARDYNEDDYEVVSVIGDGSLTGGLAYEALNHIGNVKKKLIVILNDNEMSISPNVGFMSTLFTTFRRQDAYVNTERQLRKALGTENFIGRAIVRMKANLKQMFLSELQPYEAMGFKYFGPINGHNMNDLVRSLEYAKKVDKPIIIHVKTMKGKGYVPAEKDTDGSWHGVTPFELNASDDHTEIAEETQVSWSKHICSGLVELTNNNNRVAVITPAMIHGSVLYEYLAAYPERLIDVGIAEAHAVTMAAGMASRGMKPFVSIYSSFLQRAYDQIQHDVCLPNLNVVLGIDRAGITGADGKTHQGIYDIAMLRPFPNMTIMMPRNADEAFNMLHTAYRINGPVAIRYPRGNVEKVCPKYAEWQEIPVGKWDILKNGDDLVVISVGPVLDDLLKLADDLAQEKGLNIGVVNARYIKPLDVEVLNRIAAADVPVLVYEEASLISGLGSAVIEYYNQTNKQANVTRMGVPDKAIGHGDVPTVLDSLALSVNDVKKKILQLVGEGHE